MTLRASFLSLLERPGFVLTEGAVIERLRRAEGIELDPLLLNTPLLKSPHGRASLESIYRQYIEIGRDTELPLLLGTPTWRANPERLQATGLGSCDEVHTEAFSFLDALRADYGSYGKKVFIAGLLGCRGDAYRPEESLSIDEAQKFHWVQAQALARSGVDLLLAATLPALCEALGLALVLGEVGKPYALSFVLRPEGTLLDGTALWEAIDTIDEQTPCPPSFYLANCVHPTNMAKALCAQPAPSEATRLRLIGLQANTATCSPEELDNQAALITEEPGPFAQAMLGLIRRFGLRVLGGCCGTDHRHIRALAEQLRAEMP